MTYDQTNINRLHVVGIGASAGGLEALSQFVAGLTPGLECIYVVAQHMSPTHRSMMADILGRETRIPVRELVDNELPQPDIVYIIPPGTNLTFKDGKFHLTIPSPEVSPKPSINLMFQSMADEFDERTIGIILSGTGTDGTRGLRAIKSAGGITFVQIPETAKYDGMPRSAIDACVADRILTPDQIGREIERLIRFPEMQMKIDNSEQHPNEMAELFLRVKLRTKIDFSSYKLSTVQRRLQRRMVATEASKLSDYLAYTESHPEELDSLAKETLISVTEFFRDKEAFRTLERFGRELLEQKKVGDELRIWVVGCATGEEAYSLAILFSELIMKENRSHKLQVFATDIDNDALAVARRGIYNRTAMDEVPPELIDRYFITSGNGFEPTKALRERVTFARQDVAADPPFLRLDLVTCRNVLIYFNTELQARVLSILRYALRDDGLLFLGRSETVSQQEALFAAADRRARIYRTRGKSRPASVSRLVRGKLVTREQVPKTNDKIYEKLFHQALSDCYSPSLLVDAGFHILYSHGDLKHFVQFPDGTPEMNLSKLIVPELANELLTTLHRSRRRMSSSYSRKRRILSLNKQTWRIAIHPQGLHLDSELFLVVFEQITRIKPDCSDETTSTPADDEIASDELMATREHLQTLMEEMSASNEEMQALNEEVQAANEELQATNEELEASNEELQATNQELISVNEESLAKSAELAAINSDFESVHNTIVFPILVFDADLVLKRANATAIRFYDLPQSAVGQEISRLMLPPLLTHINEKLAKVLQSQRKEIFPVEEAGRSYQIYITPVINNTGMSQSVVLVIVDNTELIEAQVGIRESQEQMLSIMNHSISLISLKDASGRYEFINQRFEETFGLKADQVLGKTDRQLFATDVAMMLRGLDIETMQKLTAIESKDELTLGGKKHWLETVRFPIFDSHGTLSSVCTQANNITHKHHAEEQLRLAAKVFDRAGEAIVITDDRANIITVNDAFTEITGYEITEVVGKTPSILRSNKHSQEFYQSMWQALTEKGSWQGEIYNKRKSGEIYPEWLTINSVMDKSHKVVNFVAIFSDISAIKSSQRRIEFLATHDDLTGLPNRSLLMDRLKHGVSTAKRQHQRLALLFIDLDNFKTINDTLGHDIGDILLKQATERLQQCVRDSDTLARLGGDEFVALLANIDLEIVNAIASRIIDFLSASFRIKDQSLFVTASIGIGIYPEDGIDSATLMKNADIAMYRAKERGRNQYQFFADEMKVRALQRMTLESGLRLAIQAGNFRMMYQPQIELASGKMIGAEALLRWRDPVMGDVSPGQFIPVAEGSGLICNIGEIVIDLVLAQIARWQASGLQIPRISINVSSHQMRNEAFVTNLNERFLKHGVNAENICIELTESALVDRMELVNSMLKNIEKMGASISIDDFGTGYSSLSYLKKLPIHELKIDRSFVDGIDLAGDDRAIAKAIIDMAHALGMQVIAEGVETSSQLDVLREERCDIVQGYLFHRPLEVDAFTTLLNT
ncbi:MAG: EAL domain-containing protein [Gammaproteobacteria bacterium]|nr:EAL domain-containing protein [Gammaproteobacteria bacterium]